ncbi:MAG: YbaK/EbsC family protein [Gammaproteobacteria bacterium]|nr:YbaK/EbsC family protein [Gammaproteobacteria bacterium]
MSIAESVVSCLTDHNIDFELVRHPKTYTSRDAAREAHVPEDHIAKAVIVENMSGYAMVVIPGDGWLKLRALRDEVDRNFILADESEVKKLFADCQPGAIPPLGPVYGLETFLDEQLTSLANVYFEAGDHENLVHISGEAFHSLLKGVRHGHFSHNE